MPRSLATASARDDEPGFAALSLGVKIESHRIREINILGKAASEFLWQAFVDLDGTLGECKGGMAVSYKGISGYAPLIITLANTREVLYLVNRPAMLSAMKALYPGSIERLSCYVHAPVRSRSAETPILR